MKINRILIIALSLSIGAAGNAVTYDWTNWQVAILGLPGAAKGVINTSGGPITMAYTGALTAAQTNGIGTNNWLPPGDFQGPQVSNVCPISDFLGTTGSSLVNQILFSQPVTDPAISFFNLGQPGVVTEFSFLGSNFIIDAQGAGLYGVGGGPWLIQTAPDTLQGFLSGSGTIYFPGTYSALNFIVPFGSQMNGFTVGVPDKPVPEPSAWLTLGVGLVPLLRRARKRA